MSAKFIDRDWRHSHTIMGFFNVLLSEVMYITKLLAGLRKGKDVVKVLREVARGLL